MMKLDRCIKSTFVVLSLLITNALAANGSPTMQDLPHLRWEISAACPQRWQEVEGYIDHLENRLIYTAQEATDLVDVFDGDSWDKAEYIKWAIMTQTSSDTATTSVIDACLKARRAYFDVAHVRHTADGDGVSAARWQDDDDDQIVNLFDACEGTAPVSVDDTVYDIVDADGDDIHDHPSRPAGCALSQLDDDGDSVSNLIDQCNDTPLSVIQTGTVSNIDGCTDSDGDGESDGVDAYPYQDDTLCYPGEG